MLSDLCGARASKAYPQRFFDEPFGGLDESGIEAVVEMLSDMAKEAGSIFVVTHQATMKGMFAKVMKVQKTDDATKIT